MGIAVMLPPRYGLLSRRRVFFGFDFAQKRDHFIGARFARVAHRAGNDDRSKNIQRLVLDQALKLDLSGGD